MLLLLYSLTIIGIVVLVLFGEIFPKSIIICTTHTTLVNMSKSKSLQNIIFALLSLKYSIYNLLFWAENQIYRQNFDPSLLHYKCRMIFMGMKQKKILEKKIKMTDSKKLRFSTPPKSQQSTQSKIT